MKTPPAPVSVALALVPMLCGIAAAQDGDAFGDAASTRALENAMSVVLLVLLACVAVVITLVLIARRYGGGGESVHNMRRRYFQQCRQRERREGARSQTRNGIAGP